MKEAGRQLFEYLTGQSGFTETMSERLFPLITYGDTIRPYSIYGMFRESLSKDGDQIIFNLFVYFEPDKYDECVDFMDRIKPIIENKYEWIDDTVEVLEDSLEFMGTITFKT